MLTRYLSAKEKNCSVTLSSFVSSLGLGWWREKKCRAPFRIRVWLRFWVEPKEIRMF
jgi:hypothetical protein